MSVQNDEAGLNLTIADQPDLLDTAREYSDGGFWIALHESEVIGTIGLLAYGSTGVLRKFFVAAPWRGSAGPAKALLAKLLKRARVLYMVEIVLDTPAVATRSHGFYAKAGFRPIAADQLPRGYTYPDRDSLLLRLRLSP